VENWKPVPEYEGYYEVSDQGRVRSLDREIQRADGTTAKLRGKVLRFGRATTGYLQVNLSKEDEQKSIYVHKLVLLAFVGPRPEGMQACHGESGAEDNRLSNLRWDTVSENAMDRVRHGTHQYSNRTECPEGHPLEGENLYVNPVSKQRVCKECQRAYMREYQREYRKGKKRRDPQ
jgi:hypothetical protein